MWTPDTAKSHPPAVQTFCLWGEANQKKVGQNGEELKKNFFFKQRMNWGLLQESMIWKLCKVTLGPKIKNMKLEMSRMTPLFISKGRLPSLRNMFLVEQRLCFLPWNFPGWAFHVGGHTTLTHDRLCAGNTMTLRCKQFQKALQQKWKQSSWNTIGHKVVPALFITQPTSLLCFHF